MGRSGQEAFTLIEILVVMGIMAVLAGVLVMGLPQMLRAGDRTAMETFISSLSARIEAYEKRPRNGDYPPTSLESIVSSLGTHYDRSNGGIESVVVCLNRRGVAGAYTFEDNQNVSLENFDRDRSHGKLTNFETKELFEVVDVWGTPLAYFHHRDYASVEHRSLGRIMLEDGSTFTAVPWRNPKTKSFYKSRSFQIISAGPDMEFNTEDDVTNFRHR